MTVVLNDVVRVTAKFSIGADGFENVFHFRYAGVSASPDLTFHDDVSDILDVAYGEILEWLVDDMTFDTIQTWNITQDKPMIETAWPTQTSGTDVQEPLPYQCCGLVLFPTSSPKSQGRKFLGVFGEDAKSTGSALLGTVVNDLIDFALNFMFTKTLTIGSGVFGNWNDTLGRFAPWVGLAVNEIIKTQRRRSPGVGS